MILRPKYLINCSGDRVWIGMIATGFFVITNIVKSFESGNCFQRSNQHTSHIGIFH